VRKFGAVNRPIGCPLSVEINPEADVIKDAVLALESPQDTTAQEMRRNAAQLSPAFETAVRVHRESG
jgi:hypothetical protein